MSLLHYIGKAAMPYQLYIRRPAGGPKGPDHSSAGAQEAALRLYPGLFGRMMARSEEHTSELQSLMRISYAVFCLKKKKTLFHPFSNMYIPSISIMPYTSNVYYSCEHDKLL